MYRIPPYLKPGDTIGITCPAGAVSLPDIEDMIKQLVDWGFRVIVGQTVGTSYFKFSATDQERISDLQQMLDDDSIHAILFGRGGYGAVRIIDQLDFTHFVKHPKWLLGYSDITCFHSHIHTQFQIATIHAHMCGGYRLADYDFDSTWSIFNVLMGKKITYQIELHRMNRIGEASGILIGGNLALLSDLIGTPSDIETDGKILFIEDIGEYKYNIDRMMWQLYRAGKLSHLSGLLIGGFTDSLDNETPFGMSEYDIVWEKIKEFDYPVCFDFPVGHQARNLALKCGVEYQLNVSNEGVEMNEIYSH
jgi:muramoyltetrapeptide carboxypeptidase